MLYLQIESPKSSVLNFLDSNSFEVIISIFQRTEKVPDMERLRYISIKRIIEKETGAVWSLFDHTAYFWYNIESYDFF